MMRKGSLSGYRMHLMEAHRLAPQPAFFFFCSSISTTPLGWKMIIVYTQKERIRKGKKGQIERRWAEMVF